MFPCLPARFVLLLGRSVIFPRFRKASHIVVVCLEPLLRTIRLLLATQREGSGSGSTPCQVPVAKPGMFCVVNKAISHSPTKPNPHTVPGLINCWQPVKGKPASPPSGGVGGRALVNELHLEAPSLQLTSGHYVLSFSLKKNNNTQQTTYAPLQSPSPSQFCWTLSQVKMKNNKMHS